MTVRRKFIQSDGLTSDLKKIKKTQIVQRSKEELHALMLFKCIQNHISLAQNLLFFSRT